MPDSASASPTAPSDLALAKALSPVAALLALSVFINYIDRGSLSIAAPALKTELLLSPWQLGILLSSFFWTYTGFQIVSGWMVDRFNVNWVIAGGFFLWSIATAATGLAHGFAMLLAVRLFLGIGESVAFPSYSKILAKHFPESLRGRANSLIAAGIAGGPAFGIFFGAMLIARYGWRPFFVGLGLLCLLWLFPWLVWMPKGPGIAVAPGARAPSITEILEHRSAWGTFGGLFSYNYLSYFLLTWLPFYLVRERHFSMDKMGRIGGAAVSHSSGLRPDFRLGVRCLDCGRRFAHPRAQDFRSSRLGAGFMLLPGRRRLRFRSAPRALLPLRHLRCCWPLHFQSMGHHANAGRPSSRRKMDRPAKLRRQPRWNRFSRANRLCRRAHGPFLLGLCGRFRGTHGWRGVLGLYRRPRRTRPMASKSCSFPGRSPCRLNLQFPFTAAPIAPFPRNERPPRSPPRSAWRPRSTPAPRPPRAGHAKTHPPESCTDRK